MAEKDSSISENFPTQKPAPSDEKHKNDDFERFRAEKALTQAEKAALPPYLRRLLGWERPPTS